MGDKSIVEEKTISNAKKEVVYPGYSVKPLLETSAKSTKHKIILGPGITKFREDVICVRSGILKKTSLPGVLMYWIDSKQKRYVAVKGDRILGTVVSKGSMTINVDIGTHETAALSMLAFEGATKRNKPIIQVGDIIFARVLAANKDVRTELVCVTGRMKKDGLGVLPVGGLMITAPLHICRRLLTPDCDLLNDLGKQLKYEIAVGHNGRIWIRSVSTATTIFIANRIQIFRDSNVQ